MEVETGDFGLPGGADKLAPEMETSLTLPNVENLITDLKAGKIQILNVAEMLGPFLTSTDIEVRIQGVRAFNDILASLSEDFLKETQLNFIVTFYADRLNDNHKVVPTVLDGVLTIIKMKNLSKEVLRALLKSLFDNVPCQQQIRTDRLKIYTIFDLCIANYIEYVKDMGTDFVLGLVFSIDGERDPRNLSYLFSILPPFLKCANLGHVAEEMFEVLACYFPVDFNTPHDDPNAITRENLAESLSFCLSASPSFAQFCLPLLLEKLDSNLKVAKSDSMELLIRCCSTYHVSLFESHLEALWQALFKEISQENDVHLKDLALKCLSELLSYFSSEIPSSSICERFLKIILVPVKVHLLDSKIKSKYESFTQLLLCVANASDTACISVMQNINSALIRQFNIISDESIRAVIVNFFLNMFNTCRRLKISLENTDYFNCMFEMIEISTRSIQMDLKLSGFIGLGVMAELMTSNESVAFLDILKYNIDYERNQIVAEAGQIALINLIKFHSDNFKPFIDELCKLNLVMDNSFILGRRLNLLCSLMCVNDYTHIVADKLKSLMFDIDMKITTMILEVLSNVIQKKDLFDNQKLSYIQMQYNIIDSVLQLSDKIITDEVVEDKFPFVSNIIGVFMKSQDSIEQSKLLNILIPRCMEQISQKNNMALLQLEALLNSSRQELPVSFMGSVISGAVYFAIGQNKNYIQRTACLLIANVLNKYSTYPDVIKSYEDIKIILSDTLKNNYENDMECSNSLVLISWLTKSLLLSRHPDATYWLSILIEMLKNDKRGLHIAKQFKLIMKDSDKLNTDCFCKYNVLYKQRVFQTFINSTTQGEMILQNEAQFLAFAYIVQYVSKDALVMELSKISRVFLDCLNFNEPDLLNAILDGLIFLIKNGKLSSGLQILTSRCLKLCDKENSIKIRTSSLECLFIIAEFYPTDQLLHYRQDVILELSKRLDDPKRIVRNMAVKARTRWFLVGSPGEDKDK